jgi:hypothetical protein
LVTVPEVPTTFKSLAQKPMVEVKAAVRKPNYFEKAAAKPATLI